MERVLEQTNENYPPTKRKQMDNNVANSVRLTVNILSGKERNNSLGSIPIFKEIRDDLTHQKQQQKQWGQMKNKQPSNRISRRRRYIPPLSAYSAESQAPYYPFNNDTNSQFDEFEMRAAQTEKRLREIRMMGWNSIRPIGVGKTMRELEEERLKNWKKSEQQEEPQGIQIASAQENTDGTDHIQEQEVSHVVLPNMDVDLDRSIEEEHSYDYDDEFARVGQEEEGTSEGRPGGAHTATGLSIQQFIETSHIEGAGHPYDIEDEYEHDYMLSIDNDNERETLGDDEFTQLPPLDVSDTIENQAVNPSRISSLNQLDTSRERLQLEIPANNSDLEDMAIE